MALLTKTQVVCDVCENPRRRVRTYRIAKEGESLLEYVLCQEHSRPVDDILDKVPGMEPLPQPRAKVYTMEEIEEMKKGTAI